MEHEFWHERWRTRQIGFHRASPHPLLERWWPTLALPPGTRIYVPLCGKSLDMVWLAAHGHAVVGSELSAIAAEEFFAEQRVPVEVSAHGPFQRHAAGDCEILQGDALELTPELLGPIHGAYDRGALVALPPELRKRYARQLASLTRTGAKVLLISFEYVQSMRPGPPFSVEPDEIASLYGAAFSVREIERVDILAEDARFVAAGVPSLHEVAYQLERR